MKRFHLRSPKMRCARAGAAAVIAATIGVAACSGDDDAGGPSVTMLDPNAPPAGAPGGGLDASVTEPNGDAAGTPAVDGACGGTTVKASARGANILMVVDASGSMLQKPDGFAVRKWDAISTSLRDALGPVRNKLSLGLELFPHGATSSDSACSMPIGPEAIDVPIGPGSTTLDTIVAKVSETVPGGATPTAKAIAAAREYFVNGAGKDLEGDKYVILATDGGPNCNTALTCGADACTTNIDGNCSSGNCCDPSRSTIGCLDGESVTRELAALKDAGVKTFVVGIPGTEAYRGLLDQFAEAGGFVSTTGPDKYYSVSAAGGVAGLTSVFALITGELITTCRIGLDEGAPDASLINVYVDDKAVPQGGDNGWELDTSTDPPAIIIKGRTCETVKERGARVISVVYGCPTIR